MSDERDDGRKAFEFTGVIYLREDEVKPFEDALEDAICPDTTPDLKDDEHDCRLGIWTLKKSASRGR